MMLPYLFVLLVFEEQNMSHDRQEEEHEYDVIGHPQLNFQFVVVFPFHPYTDGRKGGEVRSFSCEKSRFFQFVPAVSCNTPVCERCFACNSSVASALLRLTDIIVHG